MISMLNQQRNSRHLESMVSALEIDPAVINIMNNVKKNTLISNTFLQPSDAS